MSFSPKKILVATDFSPSAAVAADVASDLARQSKGSVLLFHVVELVDVGSTEEGGKAGTRSEMDSFTANARASLAHEAERLGRNGIPVTTSVTAYGPSQQQIADLAAREGAELVVVGSHGRTGLKRLLMGSVAEGVLRLCPCPVLVVHLPKA